MHKIILVGYMGSGKTTIAKALSAHLSIPYFDLDRLIEEKIGLDIPQIFAQKGEIWFRKTEHEVLKRFILENDNFILSLGGGTPCYAGNHLILQEKNISSFYLKAKVSTLTNRLENDKDHRPLLQNINTNLSTFIGQHLFERIPFYNFAKHKINIDDKTIKNITLELCDRL